MPTLPVAKTRPMSKMQSSSITAVVAVPLVLLVVVLMLTSSGSDPAARPRADQNNPRRRYEEKAVHEAQAKVRDPVVIHPGEEARPTSRATVKVDPAEEAHPTTSALLTLTFFVQTHGKIVLKLHPEAAPKTVNNFIRLARSQFYNDTSFYRFEKNFCLQGGAWPKKRSPFPPVPLEYNVKFPNKMYAVSTARTADPDSATCEFSIMMADNSHALAPGPPNSGRHGYAVFATVVDGFDTIEKLTKLPTKVAGLTMFVDPPRITHALVEGPLPASYKD